VQNEIKYLSIPETIAFLEFLHTTIELVPKEAIMKDLLRSCFSLAVFLIIIMAAVAIVAALVLGTSDLLSGIFSFYLNRLDFTSQILVLVAVAFFLLAIINFTGRNGKGDNK
jgi:hypothetical protein